MSSSRSFADEPRGEPGGSLIVPDPNAPREGSYEESAEQAALWARFANRMEQVGGAADLAAKITEFRHPYPLRRKEGGVMKVTDPGGCLVVCDLTVPGFEGLRFFRDGKYSLDPRSMLYAAYCAAMRRRLRPGESGEPRDIANRHVIITVTMGERKQKPDHGGFFWNITAWRSPGTKFEEPPPPPPARVEEPPDDYDLDDVPF